MQPGVADHNRRGLETSSRVVRPAAWILLRHSKIESGDRGRDEGLRLREQARSAGGLEDFTGAARSAVISIDMHQGILPTRQTARVPRRAHVRSSRRSTGFMDAARDAGVPIIHVKSVLRKGGVDDVAGIPSAWRRTFPLHVGAIPNSDAHAIEARAGPSS